MELRIWDAAGAFRVVYVVKPSAAIYVLYCFQKKTRQTVKRDIDLARVQCKAFMEEIAP